MHVSPKKIKQMHCLFLQRLLLFISSTNDPKTVGNSSFKGRSDAVFYFDSHPHSEMPYQWDAPLHWEVNAVAVAEAATGKTSKDHVVVHEEVSDDEDSVDSQGSGGSDLGKVRVGFVVRLVAFPLFLRSIMRDRWVG